MGNKNIVDGLVKEIEGADPQDTGSAGSPDQAEQIRSDLDGKSDDVLNKVADILERDGHPQAASSVRSWTSGGADTSDDDLMALMALLSGPQDDDADDGSDDVFGGDDQGDDNRA